jgi:hypothetical protein
MFSILSCMCSRFCQADSTCDRLPRFQVYLDAQDPQIHRSADACASHLGAMVIALTTWAGEQHLADADLTVLTIAPPPRESHPRRQSHPRYEETRGFVFSTIHLHDQGSIPAAQDSLTQATGNHTHRWDREGPVTSPLARPSPEEP